MSYCCCSDSKNFHLKAITGMIKERMKLTWICGPSIARLLQYIHLWLWVITSFQMVLESNYGTISALVFSFINFIVRQSTQNRV
jgi:hypothetical protein